MCDLGCICECRSSKVGCTGGEKTRIKNDPTKQKALGWRDQFFKVLTNVSGLCQLHLYASFSEAFSKIVNTVAYYCHGCCEKLNLSCDTFFMHVAK